MTYIYDILVNFMDGDRVVEFFEWDKRDVVEHVNRMPLIRVDDLVFFDFITNRVCVSLDFLELIYKKSSFFNSNNGDYYVIISNLEKAYAIEFSSDGRVIARSSLLLDEEDEVVCFAKKLEVVDVKYTKEEVSNLPTICTRREVKNRNLVIKELESAYSEKDYNKIKYFYDECFDDRVEDYNIMYKKLMDSLGNMVYVKKLSFICRLMNRKRKIK